MSLAWFPQLFRQMREAFPEFAYDVWTDMATPMAAALEQGKLDLAIIPAIAHSNELLLEKLGTEDMMWVVAATLLRGQAVPQDRGAAQALLDRCPLWCVPQPSYYFNLAMDGLAQHGLVPRQVNSCNHMVAAYELAIAEAGVVLVGREIAQVALAAGTLVPACGRLHPPPVEIFLAWNRNRNRPHRLLHELIKHAHATRHQADAGGRP